MGRAWLALIACIVVGFFLAGWLVVWLFMKLIGLL